MYTYEVDTTRADADLTVRKADPTVRKADLTVLKADLTVRKADPPAAVPGAVGALYGADEPAAVGQRPLRRPQERTTQKTVVGTIRRFAEMSTMNGVHFFAN